MNRNLAFQISFLRLTHLSKNVILQTETGRIFVNIWASEANLTCSLKWFSNNRIQFKHLLGDSQCICTKFFKQLGCWVIAAISYSSFNSSDFSEV